MKNVENTGKNYLNQSINSRPIPLTTQVFTEYIEGDHGGFQQ
jgi:hypothetical protein